jgi:hypothetical protein
LMDRMRADTSLLTSLVFSPRNTLCILSRAGSSTARATAGPPCPGGLDTAAAAAALMPKSTIGGGVFFFGASDSFLVVLAFKSAMRSFTVDLGRARTHTNARVSPKRPAAGNARGWVRASRRPYMLYQYGNREVTDAAPRRGERQGRGRSPAGGGGRWRSCCARVCNIENRTFLQRRPPTARGSLPACRPA